MTQEILSLGDRGLDLVLSGGLRWVRRVAEVAGASILVRGPAGSGKTLVGVTLARALARQLQGPVAYGCVELLPTELEAQVRSLFPASDGPVVRYSPFDKTSAANTDSLLVSLLELEGNPDRLGEALDGMWSAIEALGARPRVLVIDSLIDGYGIGSNVSREFADAICKLTARWGIALILLEECDPAKTSPWVYAVDTVVESGAGGDEGAGSSERWLRVPKHRFGPSDVGPHRFVLQTGVGVTVFPRPNVWLESWAKTLIGLPSLGSTPKFVRQAGGITRLTVPGPVVAVHGSEASAVMRLADSLVSDLPPMVTRTLWYDFQSPLSFQPIRTGTTLRIGLSHPYLTAERLLARALDPDLFDEPIAGILLSDVRAIRSTRNTTLLRSALATFCLLMRSSGIPVVLVETSPTRFGAWQDRTSEKRTYVSQPGLEEPDIVQLADVAVEVVTDDWTGDLLQLRVTDTTTDTLRILTPADVGPL